MQGNYANAKEVLPDDLFEKLRKHYTGMLYIPAKDSKAQRVKKLVFSLTAGGASSREIEIITGLTRRRINQIRAEYKADQRPPPD
jgi:hypothetical protein